MFTFPVTHWASLVQELTINNGNNFVLTSHTPFTDLIKSQKIIVTLTGHFYSTSTSVDAFDCGDLSTWADVDIIIDSGCTIFGKGGGGSFMEVAGLAGGPAFDCNSANSDTILSVTNDGEIGGGGGGGGGGNNAFLTNHNLGTGKDPVCTHTAGAGNGAGGGGGGGRSSSSSTSAGGAAGNSNNVGVCVVDINSGAGSAGGTGGAGGGGAAGTGSARPSGGSSCPACQNVVGTAGGGGGTWATAGSAGASGGGGGSAGTSVLNKASADYTNNGTEH